MLSPQIQPVTPRRELRAFVRFPWRVYEDDPNWVPPLISESLAYLDPARGPFYGHADVALFLARRGREVVGTIAAFVDQHRIEHMGQPEGGFGFFEVIEDYAVAEQLMDAACEWLRVLNLSLSAPATTPYFVDPLNRAVERAWAAGIVVVAAAGNGDRGRRRSRCRGTTRT